MGDYSEFVSLVLSLKGLDQDFGEEKLRNLTIPSTNRDGLFEAIFSSQIISDLKQGIIAKASQIKAKTKINYKYDSYFAAHTNVRDAINVQNWAEKDVAHATDFGYQLLRGVFYLDGNKFDPKCFESLGVPDLGILVSSDTSVSVHVKEIDTSTHYTNYTHQFLNFTIIQLQIF
jgi:hypothetical protein